MGMNLELDQDGLCMKSKQLLKVRGGAGHTIVCHSGSVWVTQERDRRDTVLGAGESFALDRSGLALVQAFEQSAISVARPARSRRAPAPAALPRNALAGAGLAHAAAGD
jgi:hypothetical protein